MIVCNTIPATFHIQYCKAVLVFAIYTVQMSSYASCEVVFSCAHFSEVSLQNICLKCHNGTKSVKMKFALNS